MVESASMTSLAIQNDSVWDLDHEEEEQLRQQYPGLNRRNTERDTISQMSMDSTDSR